MGKRKKNQKADGSSSIIVVARDVELTQRVRGLFPDGSAQVDREPNIDRVLERFESEPYDVLLITSAAFKAGEIDGIELLEVIAAKSPATQVLFLVEKKDIKIAMSALKAGTYQYAKLPVSDVELRLLIRSAMKECQQFDRNLLLTSRKVSRFEQLVGRSQCMQQVYRQIRQAAATEIPVLLLGETGTGKDLAARAIHQQGERSEGPYVPVNLGALPPELVASELFGHTKGAFTGAVEPRKGKFELANDGTVFLDEIGSIDEKVQVSLLRLIEQKRFHRLGGRRAVSTNARLIAASNQDLAEAVRCGTFRQDLYFRLDVFAITMPPLRERHGDVPLLVSEFLKRYNREFEKKIVGIGPECISSAGGLRVAREREGTQERHSARRAGLRGRRHSPPTPALPVSPRPLCTPQADLRRLGGPQTPARVGGLASGASGCVQRRAGRQDRHSAPARAGVDHAGPGRYGSAPAWASRRSTSPPCVDASWKAPVRRRRTRRCSKTEVCPPS